MSVVERPLDGLALCAGGAGLELGLRLALGAGYRTVGYVERDVFAASCLVARMAEASLDQAPVWDDLATFDGRPWSGAVDLISAGFPCQPFSQAGKRQGTDDDRWLWPDVGRVVREVGPRLVFMENVPDLLRFDPERDAAPFDSVLADLAALGFDAEWTVLGADEVGATQQRDRVFVLAHRDIGGLPQFGSLELPDDGKAPRRHHTGGPSREDVARADSSGRRQWAGTAHDEGNGQQPPYAGLTVGNATSEGRQGRVHGASERREGLAWDGPLFPPGPNDSDGWQSVLEVEPGLEPSVHGVADGLAYRVDRARTIGNGVVPLVAAAAFVHLARRGGLMRPEPHARKSPDSDPPQSAARVSDDHGGLWPDSSERNP